MSQIHRADGWSGVHRRRQQSIGAAHWARKPRRGLGAGRNLTFSVAGPMVTVYSSWPNDEHQQLRIGSEHSPNRSV